LLAGTYGKKEAPTFQEFVSERWLSTYPKSVGNRPTSIREKEIHVRVHLLPVLGRLRLDRISGEVVARLFARLRTKLPDKKALAEKTIKNVRATLRRILASAACSRRSRSPVPRHRDRPFQSIVISRSMAS
jgi:hypothetical protein